MFRIAKEIKSFFIYFISILPGAIGNFSRRHIYRKQFKSNCIVNIGQHSRFLGSKSILFKENVVIGNNAFFTSEGGEISIGANCNFNTNVHINASVGGTILIGDDCLIGPNVVMRTADHVFSDMTKLIREQGHIAKDIRISDDVWLGSNVIVVGGVTIGKGSVIGAGAVVTKDIPPYSIAVGVPARVIKKRV
jgi:galactoside O-acetyltransferase